MPPDPIPAPTGGGPDAPDPVLIHHAEGGHDVPDPLLSHRAEGGHDVPVLVWRLPSPVLAISSAVLGGGVGPCEWLVNATVPMSYDRDDPADHLTEIADGFGLKGRGVGLMTGVDVADMVSVSGGGVRLWATVGLGAPIQAAHLPDDTSARLASASPSPASPSPASPSPTTPPPTHSDISHLSGMRGGGGEVRKPVVGTVNVVAWVPARLSDGALVNAVATVTEAKTQAIRELGLDATGTATDAVCVLCPLDGPIAAYAGPRSLWGAALARATYAAVLDGGAVNLAGTQSWSDRVSGR